MSAVIFLPFGSAFALGAATQRYKCTTRDELQILQADAEHLSCEKGCHKTNKFIFDSLSHGIRTVGATCSYQKLRWCIRTGGRLCCKRQEKMTRQTASFAKGGGIFFANEGNDLLFRGE